MKNVLITGATGNIGRELITKLYMNSIVNIFAGVRNTNKATDIFKKFDKLEYRYFDFEDPNSFGAAFENIDIIFLLRPPHISEIQQYFYPLFKKMNEMGISKIVFLSVQGAEKSNIIPHNKIEALIKKFNFSSIILRPSYFMQNLTTTLLSDIKNRKIILPSGKAKFNWIDILDIAEVSAEVIVKFDQYNGHIFELTGTENISFKNVVKKINSLLNLNINFVNVNPFKYFLIKKKEGVEKEKILVMLFLHFLPRFQKEPVISMNVEKIVKHSPIKLKEFILHNKEYFLNSN